MTALERSVWMSLSTSHSALSTGNALARRYAREINLFASARDDSAPALTALADLVHPGERVIVLQVPAIVVPQALVAVKEAKGVQMLAARSAPATEGNEDIVPLTASAPILTFAGAVWHDGCQPGSPPASRRVANGRFCTPGRPAARR